MRLDIVPLSIPYRAGRFAISGEVSEAAESRLVILRDEEVTIGLGEGIPSKRVLGMDAESLDEALRAIKPALGQISLDCLPPTPAEIIERIDTGNEGGGGTGPLACGLDGALLDAWANTRKEPLWRVLGLPRPRIETSGTVNLDTPEAMGKQAWSLQKAGFSRLKLKLGDGEAADRARLTAVREACPDAVLRVDANEGWSLRAALSMVEPLSEARVELIEQPLARNAGIPDHHRLNRALDEHDLPHVLDEAVHTADDVKRMAAQGLAHGVNLKLQKAGGLRAGLEVIETARAHGLRVMLGCFIETWAGISLALQLAGKVDWADLDGAWLLADEPVVPLEPLLKNGVLEAGGRPGLGVAIAPEPTGDPED